MSCPLYWLWLVFSLAIDLPMHCMNTELSLFESDYSINENIAISDFLFKMNELGLHYIYLKPKNKDQLIYHATCLGDEKAFRSEIYVKEQD